MQVNQTNCQSISVEEKQEVQLNDMGAHTVLNAFTKPYTNFNFNAQKTSLKKIKHVLKVFFSKGFIGPISIDLKEVLLTSKVFHVSQKLPCLN